MVKEITTLEQFKNIIENHETVFIKFFATWCGPCRKIKPAYEEAEKEYKSDNCVFLEVDVDEGDEVSEHLKIEFMPYIICYKNGYQAETFKGTKE